ncbi:MAG: GNAT family N-acetyltransferase [Bdellovibrionales bacterium]|nr:GNAT family N-acetyltransferase [Bdellovibrionales bacterium]
MSHLILRELTPNDEVAFLRAVDSWDDAPGFIFADGFATAPSYASYLQSLDDRKRGINLAPNRVPDTFLCGFVGSEIVGRLGLRHSLNDFLLRIGGHIGYGVLPAHRRRGYATEMLRQSLPFARALGLQRALVTCDDSNVASIRTIENCGGVLENILNVEGQKAKRRYWIAL